jgi:hypothetical protein
MVATLNTDRAARRVFADIVNACLAHTPRAVCVGRSPLTTDWVVLARHARLIEVSVCNDAFRVVLAGQPVAFVSSRTARAARMAVELIDSMSKM